MSVYRPTQIAIYFKGRSSVIKRSIENCKTVSTMHFGVYTKLNGCGCAKEVLTVELRVVLFLVISNGNSESEISC